MKFGIITFPGSNCDEDIIYILETIYKQPLKKLWHKDTNLKDIDFIIIPGGFSYGDYLRSGAIAKLSPIMNELPAFVKKGNYVLGICNGFQILCESNLLEGTLLHNKNQNFICKNTYIKPVHRNSIITQHIHDKAIKIPIAHNEGNYFIQNDGLQKLYDNEQVLFQYCDNQGNTTIESNPNGAIDNIAGICNIKKNIFGIMPHPERAADEELKNIDGKQIFNSILNLVS